MPNKTAPNHAAPFLSEDSEACFNHFSALLTASPPSQLETLNIDPDIVRVNVTRGVDAVKPHSALLAQKLPLQSPSDYLELPSLALALAFIVNRIFTPASPQEIRAHQTRLRPVRGLTLDYLEIAAALHLVPADQVQAIRANRGPLDEAHDGVAIVAMFRQHASALAHKHPFSEEALAQLAQDGNWLILQLTPQGATPGKSERSPDAILRDQFWTDLVRRYDELYHAGVAIWGRRKVDDHIPPLNSHVAAKPQAATPPAPVGPKLTPVGPEAVVTPMKPA